MTTQQLGAATKSTSANADKFLTYVTDTCARYNILSPARQLCFLAQVGHESGGLYYTEELASGQAYEGRADLGNVHPGDGVKFKGRGLIQITGYSNYQLLGTAFGVDLISNPALLGGKNVTACTPTQLKYAALSAGWFWDRHQLNLIADKIQLEGPIDEGANLGYFKQITKVINGGYNGLNDRLVRYQSGLPQFLHPAS